MRMLLELDENNYSDTTKTHERLAVRAESMFRRNRSHPPGRVICIIAAEKMQLKKTWKNEPDPERNWNRKNLSFALP